MIMKKIAVTAIGMMVVAMSSGCHAGSAPEPIEPAASGDPAEAVEAGAVSDLASEEESGGHFTDMVDMLKGRVSGLQVSESPSGEIVLQIRGTSSFMADEQPLVVVDGVSIPPYAVTSTLRTMDPRDVRSIRVLKDVGSTSAYGVRGANGVIVITLRRGGEF